MTSVSHKFTTLDKAVEEMPDLPWKARHDGATFIFNSKEKDYVEVKTGQFIVKTGNLFEVSNKAPTETKSTKPAPKGEEE